jgi:murein DD-endopeptidase MepM/ murein hydrolase activator NlpD
MRILVWLFSKTHYELKVVLATFAVLFLLPIFGVVVIANAGITEVANALASLNPITHKIEVKDANGTIIAEFEASTVWPARGYVSDEFGSHDLWRRLMGLGPHTGIDIANEWGNEGDPVTPFMKGRVIKVIDDTDSSGYGKYVVVDHGYNVTSIYAHLSAITTSEEQEVEPGDLIGLEGTSGTSTGVHLHFEIRVYGIPTNPRTFMVGEPEGDSP